MDVLVIDSAQGNSVYQLDTIRYIKENYPEIEVIAGGGIDSIKDVEYYKEIGADHVSFGTVCFNPLKLRKLV